MTTVARNMLEQVRGELGLALVRTFITRGITALGSFLLLIVIGWQYGVAGVGLFALAQSIVVAAAIFGRLGTDNALMRFVARDVQSPHVAVYLRRACLRSLLLSTIATVAVYFSRGLWASWFDSEQLPSLITGFAVAIPAFTLGMVLAGFFKAVHKPATACLLENGAISLLAAAFVGIVGTAWPSADIGSIGWAYGVAAWLVLGQGIWQCLVWFRSHYTPVSAAESGPDVVSFNRSALAFFVITFSSQFVHVWVIWVAGYFLAETDVGLFKAAQQIAMLIGMVLVVINSIFPPRFARLYYRAETESLAALVKLGVKLGLALATLPLIVCMIAPGAILGLVGQDFSNAANLLRILALARLVSVACGSLPFLLNMAGYEPLVRNIDIVAGVFLVAGVLLATPVWGVFGVAFCVACDLIGRNLAHLYYAWHKLGIWALPVPVAFTKTNNVER